MPPATLAITLAEREQLLASTIPFDSSREVLTAASWRPIADAMDELMRSLLQRRAIPEPRLRYFDDPAYFIGRSKRSRLQGFELNGASGADIFRHGNFLKYLRYFVYGPDLDETIVATFRNKVRDCGEPFTGSDALDVANLSRTLTRSHGLATGDAAEEFFKLALDCGMTPDDARTVRDTVKKTR